jgi:hypothetical protein
MSDILHRCNDTPMKMRIALLCRIIFLVMGGLVSPSYGVERDDLLVIKDLRSFFCLLFHYI